MHSAMLFAMRRCLSPRRYDFDADTLFADITMLRCLIDAATISFDAAFF